ncbi:hypothetical protein ASG36_18650 [Geodermatophilus sp. Leaf369]|uniref:hypothetical protein n=1 Tax=Geodermatophilus sp. Leaf369 TaxID=1736354 RepID=UPI0006F63742|nr:hypothetical protein [Geodermatophilus sp. Leaf369]KQS57007.1 hypothetical protein ASG36_18650 [Geodermatophilus sp. Leaf369]
MTAVLDRPAVRTLNRPLLGLAALMAATAVVIAGLATVDPVQITGTNGWFKPLKFSVSIAVYALTLAWLLSLLPQRRQRLGRLGAWVVVVAMVVEMLVITGAVAAGTTSHFNVSSPTATALWAAMGTAIAAVWLVTLVVAALLWRLPDADPARQLAIRAGLVIGLAGMAVAFFMTSPTSAQLDDFAGVAGAHAVGVADGGPGLPFLGWSTVGGDLRVPHFVGMHALQVLPLLALGLELLSRRVPALQAPGARYRVVAIASVGFAVLVVLLTLQALAGIPVTEPLGFID